MFFVLLTHQQLTEKLFTTESSIKRFTRENTTLTQKILNKIRDFLNIFKGTNAKRETVVKLIMAEYLFDNALKEIKEKDVVKSEQFDNSKGMMYAKKGYAERNPKSVTEKEFNHHYWAVANNLLSKEELGVLNSAIGNISRGEVYNKNSDGFFMIPVGEKGILNKIIFTDGKKGSYSINSIIEIACNNETDLTDIRGVIYAGEKHGIHTENSELFKIYYGKDYRYNDFITELQNSSQDSNGEQDGARSDREVKFSLKDSDGNELDNSGEIRYSIKENLQEIHIEDKQEYAKLSQALASKNGNKPKKVEYAFTDNNFYVVKDNRLGHFTPVLQVEIVGNEKLIDSIKENIKNGSHRKATTIAEWAGIVQSGTRSDNRDNGSITRRETNGYANELYGEESESNARRNTSQNSRNSKKVVRYDFENGIVTYKDGTTAKFSLKDSAGTSLSLSQREFFKDSKILDENGNLLVMYHGTGENFTIFDLEKTGSSNDRTSHLGFWFTPKKSTAEYFADFNSNEYLGKKGRVRKVYLNITNPKIYEPVDNSSKIKALEEKNEDIKKENAGYRKRMSEIVDRFYYSMYFDDGYSLFNNPEHDLGYRVGEEYYVKMFKMTEEQAKEVYSLTRKVLENKKIIEKNNTEIGRLEDGDSFMQMADDLDEFMEWINPSHNHERGYGRENYVSTNAREAAEKFRNKLIKQGYDGIWVKNTRMDESGDQIVAFYPEQIKLTTNKKPTENPDIRFSLKDSQDRTLTEAQIEYFKDSKVRDEQGRLQVVYHATNNYEEKETWNEQRSSFDTERTPFTIFKKQYDEQFGHFFGKDINNAGGYGNRIYSVYLNIKSPLIIDCKGANYSYIKFNGEARDTYEWAEYAYKKGYDGVIFKNVRDGVDYGSLQEPTDEYVAFRSNQIKNIDNKNPTYSADIRFSLKGDATYTLSDGQVKKKIANFTKLKVYSKVEAESIINSILETNFNLGDYSVRISGKTKAEAIDVLWKTLNTADAGKRTGISLKIADYIIDNTIIESIYLEEENQIYTETISFLKPYLHSVDLKALKGEIKYRYDTDNSVYLLWGKKKAP